MFIEVFSTLQALRKREFVFDAFPTGLAHIVA
jgi:hypothetical protein